jgi:hypothetical protein
MKLIFQPSIPIQHKIDKITKTLNTLTDISATSEFINEIPRHYIITIKIPDNSTHQDVLEIGALIGVLDNDR